MSVDIVRLNLSNRLLDQLINKKINPEEYLKTGREAGISEDELQQNFRVVTSSGYRRTEWGHIHKSHFTAQQVFRLKESEKALKPFKAAYEQLKKEQKT